MFQHTSRSLFLAAALLGAACSADDGDAVVTTTTTTAPGTELDVIGLSERPASLLVLDGADAAARARLDRALDQIGGAVLSALPPRLVIAQVPAGAESLLADLGVTARFDGPVSDRDLAGATIAEARFAAVYSNRWHAAVPASERIVARRVVLAPGVAFETAAEPPPPGAFARGEGEPGPVIDPEDLVAVPYASGTVVVSILLPESNGVIDPSVEDWSEDRIRETYLKVQAALDRIASSEANADLRFVLHYESAPAAGGLDGTIDTDYEFGQRATWDDTNDEWLATADVMSGVLGRTVTPEELWGAVGEYQLALRRQYQADAAFFVIVADSNNGTSGIRAHAYIGGPWTTLQSQNGTEVFMHEFGHIFGAYDEYCPDACTPPTALHGYLGIFNANAEFREGTEPGGGINGGRGEGASSLMQYNAMGAVNGYTRGAWGWIDADGDGVVDVRDTSPRSELRAEVTGQLVRLTGQVIDRPQTAFGRTPYSVNRITGLEIELERAGAVVDVLELALPGDVRGRQPVDLTLPALPAGDWLLRVRARNQVGNLEPIAVELPVTVTGTAGTAPIAHLDLPELRALSTGASYPIHAEAIDLDGGATSVRVDLGGDGSFDTGWAASWDLDVTPTAGVYAIVVEARDAQGNRSQRRVEALVFDGNAPPEVALSNLPSLIHGTALAQVDLTATAVDPEGTAPDFSWLAQLATDDGQFRLASGGGAGDTIGFALPTPEKLLTARVDLTAGDRELLRGGWVRDLLVLDPTTVAVAAGVDGVWFVDISNLTAPRVIRQVKLETVAGQLWRRGSKLYVLGTMLTVIDIANLANAREIKQVISTAGRRETSTAEVLPIAESADWGAWHQMYVQDGERIEDARIVVRVDHPRPRQLLFRLHPPKQSGLAAIVLRDHANGPPGNRRYTFTFANTPALRAIRGAFAADGWSIEVLDDQLDGITGTLLSSELTLDTRSYAAKVLPEASRIVGRVSSGELIIAGAGLEALDVTFPYWITRTSRVRGTGTYDAVLVGDTVISAASLESKNVTDPVIRGLSAVSFRWAWSPEVIRVEDELGEYADVLAPVGTRLYAHMVPVCPEEQRAEGCDREDDATAIINPVVFASGGSHYERGRTDYRVGAGAFGNNQELWTISGRGYLVQYDVSDVTDVQVIKEYPQTWAAAVYRLGNQGDVLLFSGGAEVYVGNLADVTSTLSRTYHLSVEARDRDGGVSRAYRTVQVIPYDHAPEITGVVQTGGAAAGEHFTFQVTATDPDAGQIWDPNLIARADWNGDGVWDTDWMFFDATRPIDLSGSYDRPGTYQAVIEVRDGYWASDRVVHTVVVN